MGLLLNLGDIVPEFNANSTLGNISWHSWIEGSWAMLISHPANFGGVCTSELAHLAKLSPDYSKRQVKIASLSCDSVEAHQEWIKDIEATPFIVKQPITFPIIEDHNREIATAYGMLDPKAKTKEGLPMGCRAVYIIGPCKTVMLSMLYPASTGRNFEEVLRVIDSLQLTAKFGVNTPANWVPGFKCMVPPNVTDEEATELFGTKVNTMGCRTPSWSLMEVPSQKGYLRLVNDPSVKGRRRSFFATDNLQREGYVAEHFALEQEYLCSFRDLKMHRSSSASTALERYSSI